MPKTSPINDAALVDALTKWREHAYLRFFRGQKISDLKHSEFIVGTKRLIHSGVRNRSLLVLKTEGSPVAVIVRRNTQQPHVKNQQEIVLHVKPRAIISIQRSLKSAIRKAAKESPIFTEIKLSPEQDKVLEPTLKNTGFTIRYEILLGNTSKALSKLMRAKRPPKDLKHLGLELRALKSEDDLRKALKLQKCVATKAKAHTYFAYTPAQLRKDKKEYKSLIIDNRGLLLGVFKGSILLGLMIVGAHGENGPEQHGGLSFFLHESIQGMGITKTGYRLMLEYLKKKKIRSFYGGTSQPAIQAMGKVMGRNVQQVIYLKPKSV